MSGPLSSLRKSFINDKTSRQTEKTQKKGRIIKSMSSGKSMTPDSSQHHSTNTSEWSAPLSWMVTDLEESVYLNAENYEFRKKRAEHTLQYLTSSIESLIKNPADFIYDIR